MKDYLGMPVMVALALSGNGYSGNNGAHSYDFELEPCPEKLNQPKPLSKKQKAKLKNKCNK